MNIVYFSSKVIDYVQIYLCEIPMYVISLHLISDFISFQMQNMSLYRYKKNIQNSEIGVIKIKSRVVAL